ncbi:MAG: FkbM family methyltransferase, partial [Blastocatellia bacterium]
AKIKTDPLRADNNAIIASDGDLEIEVVPLDELPSASGRHPITLIKMDVEGYEPMVIEGARSTISTNRPIIFGEFCRERLDINGFSMASTWRLLIDELRYRCYRLDSRDKRLHILDEPGAVENIFFIPESAAVPDGLIS